MGSFAQSVISSSGNSASNGDFILSWTIGEGVISTIGSNDIELTQGFHQPLMIDVIAVGIEDDFILDIIAYPNPTYDKVIFEGGDPVGIYHIRVVDKLGRVVAPQHNDSSQAVLFLNHHRQKIPSFLEVAGRATQHVFQQSYQQTDRSLKDFERAADFRAAKQ